MPHIGWEPVEWTRESPLTDGIDEETPFYFVHSFAPRPAQESDVLGVATHGERFVCAIARPPIYGVQFHPEKSSGAGLHCLGELRRALRLGCRVILYPAIDVRDGRAVRLVQGDYERETVFDADPSDAARRWVEQGAAALHVVDLDGAREGAPVNIEQVERICEAVEVPVQVGGGLRQTDDVDAVLAVGAVRAILGTAALSDPALVEALAAEHGDRIVVSVDARSGSVAVEGWQRATTVGAAEVIADLARRGVSRFVFTPVEVDGTLGGPAIDSLRDAAGSAAASSAELIYSGGIGTLDHLRELASLGLPALAGVIVGRALYEGRFEVSEAQAAIAAGA